MSEIIIPKYREIQLEFTASQIDKDGYITLSDQFGRKHKIKETHFKRTFEKI